MLFNLFKPDIQKLKDAKNYQGLIKALENRDENIRYDAIDALGELKSQNAVEPLIKIVNGWNLTESLKAIIALGKIGDAQAVTPILEFVKTYKSRASGAVGFSTGNRELAQRIKDDYVYLMIGFASNVQSSDPVFQPLFDLNTNSSTKIIDDIKFVNELTINTISAFGRAASPSLINHLQSEDPIKQAYAAVALALIQGTDSIPHIEKLIPHPNAAVRFYAAIALSSLRDKRALLAIQKLLHDDNIYVKSAAKGAEALLTEDGMVKSMAATPAGTDERIKNPEKIKQTFLDKGIKVVFKMSCPSCGTISYVQQRPDVTCKKCGNVGRVIPINVEEIE